MHSPVHHCVCGQVLVKQCLHVTPISEMRRTWNALLHATGFDLNAHADMKEHGVTGNEIKQWKCPQKIESELVSSTPPPFGRRKANLWRRRRRRSSGCHGGHGSTRVVASMVKIFSVGLHGFPEVDTKMARDFNCSSASSFECVHRLCSSWWSVPYRIPIWTTPSRQLQLILGLACRHHFAMSLYRQYFFLCDPNLLALGAFCTHGF